MLYPVSVVFTYVIPPPGLLVVHVKFEFSQSRLKAREVAESACIVTLPEILRVGKKYILEVPTQVEGIWWASREQGEECLRSLVALQNFLYQVEDTPNAPPHAFGVSRNCSDDFVARMVLF